jgi:hypothetical protein
MPVSEIRQQKVSSQICNSLRCSLPIISLLLLLILILFERRAVYEHYTLINTANKLPILCERQRLYIQRSALLLLAFSELSESSAEVFQAETRELAHLIENSQSSLTMGDPNASIPLWSSELIQQLLYDYPAELNSRVKNFIRTEREFIDSRGEKKDLLDQIVRESTTLTRDFGLLSDAYRMEIEAGIERIARIEYLLMLALAMASLVFFLTYGARGIGNLLRTSQGSRRPFPI